MTTDCTKFIRCVYGTAYEISCQTGFSFDYILQQCVTTATARCLGSTTLASTTNSPTTTSSLVGGQCK